MSLFITFKPAIIFHHAVQYSAILLLAVLLLFAFTTAQVSLPPRPSVVVSETLLGKYGVPSSSAEDFIDGRYGTEVRLNRPAHLTSLDEWTILIAEEGTHMVRKYEVAIDHPTTLAGKYGIPGHDNGNLDTSCFDCPHSLAATPNGDYIYVVNKGGYFINRINMKNETVEVIAGTPPYKGYLWTGPALDTQIDPAFITLDQNETVHFAHLTAKRIVKLENHPTHGDPVDGKLAGIVTSELGIGPQAFTLHPHDGSAIVYPKLATCLFRVKLGDPIYRVNYGQCNLDGFQDGTSSQMRFGKGMTTLWSPNGEVLFIADTENNRIRYMPGDLSFVSTLAGNGTEGNNPGPGEDATLHKPLGLALAGSSLFFSQPDVHNVRKIDLPTCPMGQGYDWLHSDCKPCLQGFASQWTSTFCSACPPGTTSTPDRTNCISSAGDGGDDRDGDSGNGDGAGEGEDKEGKDSTSDGNCNSTNFSTFIMALLALLSLVIY